MTRSGCGGTNCSAAWRRSRCGGTRRRVPCRRALRRDTPIVQRGGRCRRRRTAARRRRSQPEAGGLVVFAFDGFRWHAPPMLGEATAFLGRTAKLAMAASRLANVVGRWPKALRRRVAASAASCGSAPQNPRLGPRRA